MAAETNTGFETGAVVEAIKPGGPHIWRSARIIERSDHHYQICFTGDKTRYRVDSKCVRLRASKNAPKQTSAPSKVCEMSSKVLHPTSAAIAIATPPPPTGSNRFECGAVVEAVKPGGPHLWRPARVVECLEDRYQVTFSGDRTRYNVGLKFVRKRPIKLKPKQTAKSTAVVDLTLWSSDSSPEPEDIEVGSNQTSHHTLLDPYLVSDPYSNTTTNTNTNTTTTTTNIHSRPISDAPSDPYAYLQLPIQHSFLYHHPFDRHRYNRHGTVLWNQNSRYRRQGNGRQRVSHPPQMPNGYRTYPKFLRSGSQWPASEADEDNRSRLKQGTQNAEEAVTREPVAVEKIAREQEKLGLDAALARVSIPRKPLPRNARRSHPRMSLGSLHTGKESANSVDRNREKYTSPPEKTMKDLPIAPPPALSSSLPSKSVVVRCPKPRRRPNIEDTVSSSDDEGDIRRGPRVLVRQRELARKRRAEGGNDETVPRKRQVVSKTGGISAQLRRRKPVNSRLSGKSTAVSGTRKTKTSKQVSRVANARGNGRRKGVAKRHAGLSTIGVLSNMDRVVDEEYARHRKEVAESVVELEELGKDMSDMRISEATDKSTSCECSWDGGGENRCTRTDGALECKMCKRRTHLMCSALKRGRILAALGDESRAMDGRDGVNAVSGSRTSLMCVGCVDLIATGSKEIERGEKEEESRWTITTPISPQFYARERCVWSTSVALAEYERMSRTGKKRRKKRKAQGRLQLAEENKKRMMQNVEDLRSGIVRCSFFSDAVSRLTVHG